MESNISQLNCLLDYRDILKGAHSRQDNPFRSLSAV